VPAECTIPSPPPSHGSCVTIPAYDGGAELDAGVDNMGNASRTTCNPITNEGCTGTDLCQPDNSGMFYDCQPAGTPSKVAFCGDCTAPQATCVPGAFCVGNVGGTIFTCTAFCCTNADCGGTNGDAGTGPFCDTQAFAMPLPDNVGICIN
jgi:hypothetical protein